ncbi:MAG: TIR domain-containing protein [Bacteroidales bacterium]|nr:TIR domain-containing protein [Bacteroidales bacterium]
MIEGKYQYFAFISYKREDEEWAKWLQHKLEHYKLPSNLNGRTDLPKEIRPIFKDTSELTPGNLPEQIHKALELSKYLIVICSPRSAQSEWVDKEVRTFISMGRTKNVIPFIIEGKPFAENSKEECFPLSLRQLPQEQEILGANINEMGRDAAVVKIIARMFDIRFDELWQRYEREMRHRRNIIMMSVAAFVLAVIGIAFWMYLQRQETLRANWEMMENQARMIAEKSKEEVNKGNTYDAILALLEISPQDGSRPFVPEMEEALRMAYDSLRSRRWNSKFIGEKYDMVYFADSGRCIIGATDSSIDIYDSKVLCKTAHITLPEHLAVTEISRPSSYLSPAKDTLFVLDTLYVLCYQIPGGELIKKEPYTKDRLLQCMDGCHRFASYSDDRWVREWKKTVGVPDDATILNYSPSKHIVLYASSAGTEEFDTYNYLTLYDCKSHQIIKVIDGFDVKGLDGEIIIAQTSFSPDGNKLAIALESGKGFVMDLNNFSTKLFDCGEENCAHYSNCLDFGYNGQLLHSSSFSLGTRIYDASTLTLTDSINKSEYAEMDYTGKICLIGSEVFYRYTPEDKENMEESGSISPSHSLEDSSFQLLSPFEYELDTIINQRYHIVCDFEKLSFNDLEREYNNWSFTESNSYISRGVLGFFPDNKYLATIREGERGAQFGIDIIDIASGIIVYHIDPEFYVERMYYNVEAEQIAFGDEEGPDTDFIINFPSFDHLVTLCRKATQGMVLSDNVRRMYDLNTKHKD